MNTLMLSPRFTRTIRSRKTYFSSRKLPLGISLLCSFLSLFAVACSSSSHGGSGADVPTLSDEDLALESQRYADGNIPLASADGPFKDIHFGYDSAMIDPEYYEVLQENAKILDKDPTLHAEVEGHCDKRGTNEYNLALGQERAKAVASLMVSYGARPSQISTISYGEEIPIDPGNSEDAFAKNRRAHFALFRKSEGQK